MSDVTLTLSQDAALILFEWLHKFNDSDDTDAIAPEDRQVLFDLEALLEKELPEIFDKNYVDLLSKARARLKYNE